MAPATISCACGKGCPFLEIPLTRGLVALVDPEVYEHLMRWEWQAHPSARTWYAVRSIIREVRVGRGRRRVKATVRMHREVLGAVGDTIVDHRNRNGLDNRRCNLRFYTKSQNGINSPPRRVRSASPFKGVWFDKAKKHWRADVGGLRRKRLGPFPTAEEAARAYDKAAREMYGEFAWLNFPEAMASGV